MVRRGLVREWVVPVGIGPWLVDCGVDERTVTELEWWESV